MREMKDSGFDWLKEIPKDWKLIRIKNLIANVYNVKKKFKEVDVLSLGVNGVVIKENLNFGMNPTNYDDHNIVKKGQYVICLRDLDGPLLCGISKYEGCLSALYYIFDFNKHVNKYFFNYIMKTTDYTRFIDAFSYGMRHSYNFLQFGNLKIPFPDLIEQKFIVEFLDKRCAEIDGITKDLQEQIETLENYKKSVITEAVTKGLNPNVEMKNSGISYVGKIPNGWDIRPVYYFFNEGKKRNYGCKENNLLSLSYGNIIRKDINSNGGLLPASFSTYNIVERNDIIIRPTDLQNDKHSLRTGLVNEHGIITSAYIDLVPKKKVNSSYYHYLLHSYDVMKVFYNMGNGVRQGLNYSEFSKLLVLQPSFEEQKEIANYLDKKCAEIEEIIKNKKEQLETIEEYKKSLIYEYVTGKKEVKNA